MDWEFQGYDPPRALVPAAAIVPVVTQADPQTPPILPRPSATVHPGPKETNPAHLSTPFSVYNPKTPHSPQISKLQSESGMGGLDSGPVTLSAQMRKHPQKEKTDLNHYQVATSEDHKEKTDLNIRPINNADEGQNTGPEASAIRSADENSRPRINPGENLRGGIGVPSGQGTSSDIDQSGDDRNNPGLGKQLTDFDHETSNGGLESTVVSRKAPKTQQEDSIATGFFSAVTGSISIPILLPQLPWSPDPITNVDGEVVQPLSNRVSVASTILTPGGPALTISSTPISLGSDALVIGSSSIFLLATEDPTRPVTSIAGPTITADPNAVHIGSSMLAPGGPGLVLSKTLISLDPAGRLAVGSETISLQMLSKDSSGYDIDVANPTALLIPSSIPTQNDPGMTPSGTTVSLDSPGTLAVGASSSTLILQPSVGSNSNQSVVGVFQSSRPYASKSFNSGNNASLPANGIGKDVQAFQGTAKALNKNRSVGFVLPLAAAAAAAVRLYL